MFFTPKRLFLALGLSAALAIIAFKSQSLILERETLLAQRSDSVASLAQATSNYVGRLYDQSGQIADEVALHIKTAGLDGRDLHDYLAEKAKDSTADDYIVVLDADGRIRATSESAQPANLSYPIPGFLNQSTGAKPRVIPALRSRLTNAIIYSLSSPIYDPAGHLIGVVGVNVKPEGIKPTKDRKPSDPLLTVWGNNGALIASSFMDFDDAGAAIKQEKPPGFGIPGSLTKRDRNLIAAANPVPGWPVTVVASYDRKGVLSAWRRDLSESLGLIVLVLLGIGILVWFGILTARREEDAKRNLQTSNAERDMLLKEVHHRVKNSLSMTAGLIHLQERGFNDPEVKDAFESLRGRLHSIGLVHEALYSGSSLSEVNLADYLGRLVSDIGDANGSDARNILLKTEVEPIMLAPNKVTPVGLIVAEIVTNAFKYAFGPTGFGEIIVRARLLNATEVQLEIRDNGKGLSDNKTPDGTGLGSRLVKSLATQLGGILSISNEGGAAFRITFPRD
jgi:two-component sensor histidine kinase